MHARTHAHTHTLAKGHTTESSALLWCAHTRWLRLSLSSSSCIVRLCRCWSEQLFNCRVVLFVLESIRLVVPWVLHLPFTGTFVWVSSRVRLFVCLIFILFFTHLLFLCLFIFARLPSFVCMFVFLPLFCYFFSFAHWSSGFQCLCSFAFSQFLSLISFHLFVWFCVLGFVVSSLFIHLLLHWFILCLFMRSFDCFSFLLPHLLLFFHHCYCLFVLFCLLFVSFFSFSADSLCRSSGCFAVFLFSLELNTSFRRP